MVSEIEKRSENVFKKNGSAVCGAFLKDFGFMGLASPNIVQGDNTCLYSRRTPETT